MNESRNLNGSRKFIATILAAGTLAFCGVAIAYTGEELAKDAKLNIQAARDIALKVRPGKITDEELEKEMNSDFNNQPNILMVPVNIKKASA